MNTRDRKIRYAIQYWVLEVILVGGIQEVPLSGWITYDYDDTYEEAETNAIALKKNWGQRVRVIEVVDYGVIELPEKEDK